MALTRNQLKNEILRILNIEIKENPRGEKGRMIKDLLINEYNMDAAEALDFANNFMAYGAQASAVEKNMQDLCGALWTKYGFDMRDETTFPDPWYKRAISTVKQARQEDAAAAGAALTQGAIEREAKRRVKESGGGGPSFWERMRRKKVDVSGFWMWFLFIVTLVAHIIVVWILEMPGFGEFWLFYFLFAAVMAMLYPAITSTGREGAMLSLVVSAGMVFVYSLPSLLHLAIFERFLPNDFYLVIGALVILLPIWPLFLAEEMGGKLLIAMRIFFGVLIFLLVVLPLFNMGPQLIKTQSERINAGAALQEGWATISDNINRAVSTGRGIISRSTDPTTYYTGQVEKNKRQPLGVTLENFRPQDRTINNETPVILHGVVKARSFTKPTVPIEPACIIDRKDAPPAMVDPPITEVVYGSSQSFTCEFPPLQTGSYSIKGMATFPFETWAYITYTFVDDERARNFARQGLDVKQELDIPEEPTAIFTNGPVKLGMGGSSMPILVKTEGSPLLQPGTRIGITLDPAWESGELQRVERIELKVPKPFIIPRKPGNQNEYDCDRQLSQQPQQDLLDQRYTNYVFENPEFGPVLTFTSLTCKLDITSADEAAALVGTTDKAVLSFVAVAKYRYTIEQKTVVSVK